MNVSPLRLAAFALRLLATCAASAGLAGHVAAQPALPAGVTPAIQVAIERGVDWLVRMQHADGAWRATASGPSYPVAMTSLAGMALVAAGSTPTRGRQFAEVRRAVQFVKRHQTSPHGLIAVRGDDDRPMYAHGFATLFLASVHGMEEDAREQAVLEKVLARAVALICSAQGPSGGWNYVPDTGFDEGSITVTQIQALRACRMVGIAVDKRTIDRAVEYVRKCQNADGGISYRLGDSGPSRPAITAAGVAVLYNAGVYDDAPFVDAAVKFCRRRVTIGAERDPHRHYAQYYWGQALYQRGGREWDDHYERLASWLLREQSPDGAWNGDGVGTVYGTAIALTLLLLPYAHVPIYQR